MIGRPVVAGLVALLSVTACGTRKTGSVKMPASGTMMTGDSMAMMAAPLLPLVRANLDSLESPAPALQDSALSHHAAVLENVLRAMRTDLMHLGLHRDPTYQALTDSARSNAAEIESASAPDHAEMVHRQVHLVRRLQEQYGALVNRGKH